MPQTVITGQEFNIVVMTEEFGADPAPAHPVLSSFAPGSLLSAVAMAQSPTYKVISAR